MSSESVMVCPITTKVDNCLVDILEVLKSKLISGDIWYHVVLRLRCPDFKSRVFCLDVRDINELEEKIKVEIAKARLMGFVLGKDYMQGVVRG